jgi:hypothetical protein
VDALAGDAFRMAVSRGIVPPPGWMFTNRFLRGEPWQWSGELVEAIPADTTIADLSRSLEAVVELLRGFERDGASLPEWLAAEQAITMNLTAATVGFASTTLRGHEAAMVEHWGSGKAAAWAWVPDMDSGVWLLCEKIREKAADIELAVKLDPQLRAVTEKHPSEMVKVVIDSLGEAWHGIDSVVEDGPTVP